MEQAVSLSREDPELLAAFARHGDQDAFRTLVERHHRLVFTVCYQALNRNQASADDAAQSVFIILARKASHINGGNLPNWLFKTSRYVVQGMQRKEWRLKRRERLVAQRTRMVVEDSPADPAENDKLGQVLQTAIARLPSLQREALLLCYFDGLDPSQAAVLLGCEGPTVRMRLHHALVALRKRLSRNQAIAGMLSIAAVEGLLTQVTSAAMPAGLAARCHAAATGASAAGAATVAIQIADQVLRYTMMKTVATVGITIIAAGSITVGTVALYRAGGSGHDGGPRTTPVSHVAPELSPSPAAPPPLPPATEPSAAPPHDVAVTPPAESPLPPLPQSSQSAGSRGRLVWEPAKAYPTPPSSADTQGNIVMSADPPAPTSHPEDQINRKWDLFPQEK